MADIISTHISTYYHIMGNQTPFNVINATMDGSLLTFDTQPNHVIARPIRERLEYRSQGEPAIPITSFDRLVDNASLGRSVDRCRWNGQDCAFKRIEFDCDVQAIEREIKSSEKLLELPELCCQTIEDANKIMEHRFNVLPILAVVVFEQGVNNDVMGILMPFGDLNLESLFASGTGATASASGPKDLQITREQLRDLTRGVRELAQVGVVHGDIVDRNTLLKLDEATAAQGFQRQNSLVLVDFGSVAPDYKNDAFALGELFMWCNVRSSWDVSDQRKVEDAAQVLKDKGDFDRALSILDDDRDSKERWIEAEGFNYSLYVGRTIETSDSYLSKDKQGK
jgi:serine/threonine protein kinase